MNVSGRRTEAKVAEKRFFHNHSDNSSVAQNQKTKRSPSRLGKHIFYRKPQKRKSAKKYVSKMAFGKNPINFWTLEVAQCRKKTKSDQLCLQNAVVSAENRNYVSKIVKNVEKSRKKLKSGTLWSSPTFPTKKLFWLSARLEPTYPCF